MSREELERGFPAGEFSILRLFVGWGHPAQTLPSSRENGEVKNLITARDSESLTSLRSLSGSGFKCKAHLTSAVTSPDFCPRFHHSPAPWKMPLENQGLLTCQLLTQIAPYQRGIEVHNAITQRKFSGARASILHLPQYLQAGAEVPVSTAVTLLPPWGFSSLLGAFPPSPCCGQSPRLGQDSPGRITGAAALCAYLIFDI